MGIALNYTFGILSYKNNWDDDVFWNIWWSVVNIFVLTLYGTFAMIRDRKKSIATKFMSSISILCAFAIGITLIIWFKQIAEGIILIGVAFYYSYALIYYLIYLNNNDSVPWVLDLVTAIIVILTCLSVMVYSFFDSNFDDFTGFSISYLVINLMFMIYSLGKIFADEF
jgi:hypothetical protein